MTSPRFVVGIDLGTTHCVVARSPSDRVDVALFPVPQLVAPGEVAGRELFPSFLYLPAEGELPAHERVLPWGETPIVAGELARVLGAKAPNRLVASAKSWICHGGVNRRAPILPWSAPEGEAHVSPLEASAHYLAHIRAAWNVAHPDAPLADQDVVVTVPASFDDGARELTFEAAEQAGLGRIRLLEEPQAAFYDFVGAHTRDMAALVGEARLVLVIDVGGGTTDLTLLRVLPRETWTDGQPRLERIAVGGHLMLGGDNMDAALAHHVLNKLGPAQRLDPSEWSALVASVRHAKERLLGPDAPEEAVVSVQRRGARLIGSTKSVVLEREEVRRVLVDGFLPRTGPDEVATHTGRAGLTTLGLPYTSDPAIPRHVCAFLRRHQHAAADAGARVVGGLPRPDLLLLNGGVFKAQALVDRLAEVTAKWFGELVPLLEHRSLDTAVAYGAAFFGLARRGLGEVIAGGTARAYYIGVAGPDREPRAVCVAPKGMEDGTTIEVRDRVFELVLDRRVTFPLFCYIGDRTDPAGAAIRVTEGEQLEPLPPLEAVLRAKGGRLRAGASGGVPVTISATVNERGALELYLVTVELPPQRWRLEFVLRSEAQAEGGPSKPVSGVAPTATSGATYPATPFAAANAASGAARDVVSGVAPTSTSGATAAATSGATAAATSGATATATSGATAAATSGATATVSAATSSAGLPATPETPLPPRFKDASRLVQRAFSTSYLARDKAKSIRRDLEDTLGTRGEWSASTCRALWGVFFSCMEGRKPSPIQELNWLQLAGWCLRPGLGAPGDEDRVRQMWELHAEGLSHPSKGNWAGWWILWRRVAAGLDRSRQEVLYDDIRPWIAPDVKPPPGPRVYGEAEMWRLVGALERLSRDRKEEAGRWFLEKEGGGSTVGNWWPLGRLGARAPFHGGPGDVVSPELAEAWLERLLTLDWHKADGAAFAAASLARVTGETARDVRPALRKTIAKRLEESGAASSWVEMVTRVTVLSAGDTGRVLGDSLPIGLRLV